MIDPLNAANTRAASLDAANAVNCDPCHKGLSMNTEKTHVALARQHQSHLALTVAPRRLVATWSRSPNLGSLGGIPADGCSLSVSGDSGIQAWLDLLERRNQAPSRPAQALPVRGTILCDAEAKVLTLLLESEAGGIATPSTLVQEHPVKSWQIRIQTLGRFAIVCNNAL